ncbi:ATP-binding cassette domain-containing protein [Shewanella sp. 10N.286.48.B5]|uniref:ATP-binding cassette domain-containing protein n=1 Tax=Shewanella sp. 10N.286.48.B5 TaxID=1880834 RepID=UPI000C840348|nr:ABC transporter ATP-binding protein [Shewanella sp. 10N.286.48.B5]PMH86135.1 ABC transporter [Shewanella sp. 10N.286.48.B5]
MKIIALEGVSFSYGLNQSEILDDLNLVINSGECHCISGPTGCGKSSLLHLIAGEVSRPYEGKIYRHDSLMVGLVMQDPNVQILRQTVGAEIAFGLENLGYDSSSMIDIVQVSLSRAGLFFSLNTPIEALSLGQKYRLMIAAQLAFEPNLLLLDEPWTQLDEKGVHELIIVLKTLLADGVAIMIAEHNPSAFSDVVDIFWRLENGKLTEQGTTCAANELVAPTVIKFKRKKWHQNHDSLLTIAPHRFRFSGQECLFKCDRTLSLHRGEIVGLVGDNGVGKSSLIKTLAGIQSNIPILPIQVLGKQPKLGAYGARLGLLLQRPSRQLFEQTVLAELQFSLKRFKLPLVRAENVLQQLDLMHLSQCSPHKLSYGQQHIIALASLVCMQPEVLLLDDPFAGLDNEHIAKVVFILHQLCDQGCGILLTGHRVIQCLEVDRYWSIEAGKLKGNSFPLEQSHVG